MIPNASLNGPLAAGIPGMPAALVYLANHYGRLPLAKTLAPAIHYARDGFPADERLLRMIRERRKLLNDFSATRQLFFVDGKPPQPGQRILQPNLAKTMERIAADGMDGFYAGETAARLVAEVQKHGGIWEMSDLQSYRVAAREPIRFDYRGATITSAGLPSSGGIVLAEIFNIVSHFDLKRLDSGEKIHILTEAMRLAYRDRAKWLGDMDFVEVPVENLTSAEYATALAQTIQFDKAKVSSELKARDVTPAESTEGEDTTHFSILDEEGNRVAATLSINYPFGSGFVADGTGILLNNEMDDFVSKPGVPNVYGLVGGDANAIEPGKRMLSSMSPTFVDDGERVAILGTPGGSRIITMVALGILAFLEGRTEEAIVGTGRFHHQYLPDEIQYEKGALSLDEQTYLRIKGHQLREQENNYGNMQLVVWDYVRNALKAVADPRGIGNGAKG